MMRRTYMLLLGSAVAVAGCQVGTGTGTVDGTLYVRECAERAAVGATSVGTNYSIGAADAPATYSMKPVYFVADPVDDFSRLYPHNRLNIRVQSDGARVEQADVLFVNIASVYDVALALGQPVEIGPNTNVRATLSLNQACPMPEVTPALEGSITFQTLGNAAASRVPVDFRVGFNDRLTATFDLNVIDLRAATLGGIGAVPPDPAVGGHLTGFFDFVVRQGQNAQTFP
jgi:hypothetical protein